MFFCKPHVPGHCNLRCPSKNCGGKDEWNSRLNSLILRGSFLAVVGQEMYVFVGCFFVMCCECMVFPQFIFPQSIETLFARHCAPWLMSFTGVIAWSSGKVDLEIFHRSPCVEICDALEGGERRNEISCIIQSTQLSRQGSKAAQMR